MPIAMLTTNLHKIIMQAKEIFLLLCMRSILIVRKGEIRHLRPILMFLIMRPRLLKIRISRKLKKMLGLRETEAKKYYEKFLVATK